MDNIGQRQAVVEEAKTWLRTPHKHLARVKGVGVDCATLLAEVYPVVFGWDKIDVGYYPPDWHLHKGCGERYLDIVKRYGQETAEHGTGDMVVFKYGQAFSHGGIIVAWPIIIHAYRQARGVVLEDVEKNMELSVRERKFFSPWSSLGTD